MPDDNAEVLGKKIFFLHPAALTQNEIIPELIQQEFEIYSLKDESRLMKALQHYPGSILFASIDEALQAKDWEILIRRIMGG